MRLGDLILEHRTRLDMSQEDVAQRLALHGFSITRGAISKWERKDRHPDDITWNPRFIDALASIFEMTPVELMHDLGFDYLPDGLDPADAALAVAVRNVEDIEKRKKLIKGLLLIAQALADED